MDCPSCGGAVPEGGRFCAQCGAPLPTSCAACGFVNPAGARFCAGCGVELTSAASAADGPRQPPPPTPAAERRQLTVLFCDLVGSTELSARLDPEEMREVIRGYQNAVAAEVARFEGHLAKFMGDGVLAYFGYPKAHEDDAERAVRAGLAITGKVGCLAAEGRQLSTRIGIATGRVVVGDLIGEGAAQEEAVVGDTPNLAARLQALAEPDSVVIAPGTRRLIGGLFELADLGVHDLKGFSEPVRAWRVVGAGEAESRFEALHGRHLIPLVGREEELNLLLALAARGGKRGAGGAAVR